jgi:hypothetical protein
MLYARVIQLIVSININASASVVFEAHKSPNPTVSIMFVPQ